LNKRWRIALGCGCLAGVATVALLGVLGWRFYLHVQESQEIAALRARVAAVPFSPPPDGVVSEERFSRFLRACARTRYLEDKYGEGLRSLDRSNERDEINLDGLTAAINFVDERGVVLARALSGLGMGMREYRWILLSLGETPWDGPFNDPIPDREPRGEETDRRNTQLFARFGNEIRECLAPGDMSGVRKGLRGYREAIQKGSE